MQASYTSSSDLIIIVIYHRVSYKTRLYTDKPMVITTQCQTGRCNECLEILDQGVKFGHKCHLNTMDVSDTMEQSLKQQQAEQEKIETITPNEPHIA